MWVQIGKTLAVSAVCIMCQFVPICLNFHRGAEHLKRRKAFSNNFAGLFLASLIRHQCLFASSCFRYWTCTLGGWHEVRAAPRLPQFVVNLREHFVQFLFLMRNVTRPYAPGSSKPSFFSHCATPKPSSYTHADSSTANSTAHDFVAAAA